MKQLPPYKKLLPKAGLGTGSVQRMRAVAPVIYGHPHLLPERIGSPVCWKESQICAEMARRKEQPEVPGAARDSGDGYTILKTVLLPSREGLASEELLFLSVPFY